MTTKTTANLKLVVRTLDHPIVPFAIALSIFLVAGIIAALGRASAPAPAAVATPARPIILIATPAPATPAALSVASAGPNSRRALVAYASPDGAVIGAIEAGRHYGFLARSGDGWLQLDIDGSGAVWVRSADLIGAPDLADVATPTDAPRVVVVSVPARVQVEAAPTPAWSTPERATLDQTDPRCTGAADNAISDQCGLSPAQLNVARQR